MADPATLSTVNVTVPVAPEVTETVKVTVYPKIEGLFEESKLTVGVASEFTTWLKALLVAGEKFVSPL